MRLIRENNWTEWRFCAALLAVALLHAVVFSYVVLTMPGTPGKYKVDMMFWGSILRKQDLVPQIVLQAGQDSKAVILEPLRLLRDAQIRGWSFGVMVDKPEARKASDNGQVLQKFLTERVVIAEALPVSVPGIPDAPRVPLKAPRP